MNKLEQALDNTIKKKKPQQRKYAVYLTADEIDAVIELIEKLPQRSELLNRVLKELKNA